ncbi:MAG: hypothetical protein JNK05_28995 [Myxococcales bacterium]|nr:hypothetical protein [Myxococcales bacterium]
MKSYLRATSVLFALVCAPSMARADEIDGWMSAAVSIGPAQAPSTEQAALSMAYVNTSPSTAPPSSPPNPSTAPGSVVVTLVDQNGARLTSLCPNSSVLGRPPAPAPLNSSEVPALYISAPAITKNAVYVVATTVFSGSTRVNQLFVATHVDNTPTCDNQWSGWSAVGMPPNLQAYTAPAVTILNGVRYVAIGMRSNTVPAQYSTWVLPHTAGGAWMQVSNDGEPGMPSITNDGLGLVVVRALPASDYVFVRRGTTSAANPHIVTWNVGFMRAFNAGPFDPPPPPPAGLSSSMGTACTVMGAGPEVATPYPSRLAITCFDRGSQTFRTLRYNSSTWASAWVNSSPMTWPSGIRPTISIPASAAITVPTGAQTPLTNWLLFAVAQTPTLFGPSARHRTGYTYRASDTLLSAPPALGAYQPRLY